MQTHEMNSPVVLTNRMTYARARLWLGITGVGLQVVLAILLLATGVGDRTSFVPEASLFSQLRGLALLLLAYVSLMTPFDWLGGYLLPRWYQRSQQSCREYFAVWARGASIHFAILWGIGASLLIAGRTFGNAGVCAVPLVHCVVLLRYQEQFAGFVARLPHVDHSELPDKIRNAIQTSGIDEKHIEIWEPTDPGFTGGIVEGADGVRIVIPSHWVKIFSAEQLKRIVARRSEIARGRWRFVGGLVALLWVTSGCLLGLAVLVTPLTSVKELVQFGSVFTLWTFFGLLILPTLSRNATVAIDRKLFADECDPSSLQVQFADQDRLQDGEPERSVWVERIFHPVPSVANRLDVRSVSRLRAWHSARIMLYLSWACGGLMARSVHCNVGRPELWVLLPTD